MFPTRYGISILLAVAMLKQCPIGLAEIYHRETASVIPGTEGIWPGPGVSFANLSLEFADLSGFDLTDANLTGADLRNAILQGSWLLRAVFDDAIVEGTDLTCTGPNEGLTAEQLYSTASYRNKTLMEIEFSQAMFGCWGDFREWNFADQNLSGANFAWAELSRANLSGANLTQAYMMGTNLSQTNLSGANLQNANLSHSTATNADFTDAIIKGARLESIRDGGLTSEQFYATASYQAKDLVGIVFGQSDLSGWDFRRQNLTDAVFSQLPCMNCLVTTSVENADFTGAIIKGADFWGVQSLLREQVYSTASYAAKDLRGINLGDIDLSDWDFHAQDLSNAYLRGTLAQTDFRDANLSNADLAASSLPTAIFSSGTIYNQWTVFPADFDPQSVGLTRIESVPGDFNADRVIDVADIELLQRQVQGTSDNRLSPAKFDLTQDGNVSPDDAQLWTKQIALTFFGDANLDGQFASDDLVTVFVAGEYEDTKYKNSIWHTGDWNSDGEFNSADLVLAFTDGGFERGPRTIIAVPEPNATADPLFFFAIAYAVIRNLSGTGCHSTTKARPLRGVY